VVVALVVVALVVVALVVVALVVGSVDVLIKLALDCELGAACDSELGDAWLVTALSASPLSLPLPPGTETS